MQQLDTLPLKQRMSPLTHPAVLVIGGAEDKIHGREILQTFFERSGGKDARIAVIPCASREPAAIAERYRRIFVEIVAELIQAMDFRDRLQSEDQVWKEKLETCTGVFITGGDQVRLCGLLADTPLIEHIRYKAQLGEITLAGTSAGAAVMGHHMIAGGGSGESPNRSLVDMATGLGILPDIIVDQHFHNRNRMARLMSAISIHPDRIGIGIDEDTCALFEQENAFTVIGKGTVTVIDPNTMSYTNQPDIDATVPIAVHGLRVHILTHGDRYDLSEGTVVPGDA